MLWLIDSCQNKVSAEQYHMRPYHGLKFKAHRGQLFFLKLTADQVLVFDWIAGQSQVNLL